MKILIPVDGSKRSIEAASKGIEIANGMNAEIYAIYVVPSRNMLINKVISGDPIRIQEELNRLQMEEQRKGEEALSAVKNIFYTKFPRGKFFAKILEGDPKREILNFSETNNIDLIVMASSKIHDKFLFGSVAEHVLRNSSCSVMIVK
ncbi:MAG: universal stress protein [Candidatus Altarchaeaceae archaeon]